jgi:hypothetical protein
MHLSINTPPDRFRNSTLWNETLWNSVNATSVEKLSQCENVVMTFPSEHETRLTFNTGLGYPNMTLILETTEINVGAY